MNGFSAVAAGVAAVPPDLHPSAATATNTSNPARHICNPILPALILIISGGTVILLALSFKGTVLLGFSFPLYELCALCVLCGEITSFCCWLSANGYWLATPAFSASSRRFFLRTTDADTAIPTKYNPTIGIMNTSIVPASGVGVIIAATIAITRIA